jgi:hypothetical protein
MVIAAVQAVRFGRCRRRRAAPLHNPGRRSRAGGGSAASVAGLQPYGLALPLNDQAVAIVFDLMKPLRPVGDLVPRVGMKGANAGLRIRDK